MGEKRGGGEERERKRREPLLWYARRWVQVKATLVIASQTLSVCVPTVLGKSSPILPFFFLLEYSTVFFFIFVFLFFFFSPSLRLLFLFLFFLHFVLRPFRRKKPTELRAKIIKDLSRAPLALAGKLVRPGQARVIVITQLREQGLKYYYVLVCI